MSAADDEGADAVAVARAQIGKPYAWGAVGPGSFDCSGLCVYCYKQIGWDIPRTSQQQCAGGQPVSRDELLPGDLIIYYPDASHVALYSGNGNVIEASTYGVPVKEVPIDYAGPYNQARRYLTRGNDSVDTLFADVSEFQRTVDDSYPYQVLSIRSNDGTYQDHNFAANYQWCANACNTGKLKFFICYFYWRPGETGSNTHMQMVEAQGGPHPQMVTMIDLESGGNPDSDQSATLNDEYNRLVAWHGGNDKKVIGYANLGDERTMWQAKPADLEWILAGYGANPNDPSLIKIAHQYTDGSGFGAAAGLPDGCPPFGSCDMNSADGLSPDQFAAACGITPTSGGPFMALTDAEQQEVLDGIRYLAAQLGPNQWGPASSFGTNAQGQELTMRDGLCQLKRDVEAAPAASTHVTNVFTAPAAAKSVEVADKEGS